MTRSWFVCMAAALVLAACGDDGNSDEDTGTDPAGEPDGSDDVIEESTPDMPEDIPTDDTPLCPPEYSSRFECSEGATGRCFCILTGTITDDLTLSADVDWLLRGGVFIGDDVDATTLTVPAGTQIFGETSTAGMLVIRRNSTIMAEGTADAPIVMSSSQDVGSRARGQWGGVIINGKSTTNACEVNEDTGVCESFGEGGTGYYGGDSETDDSGTMQYVRIQFAGRIISPDNELNGLALQGVGSGTTLEHIQIHMNKDDAIEFFGGTANFKYVLGTGTADDNLDWTDGWRGKGQFYVCQQYSDDGDNGIEADNNGEANDATPRSHPTLSNLTLVGSPDSSSSDMGMLIREGTAGDISCAIVTGWNDACIDVDHTATFDQIAAGTLTITDSIVHCTTGVNFEEETDDPSTVQAWFETDTDNAAADPLLGDPFNESAPDLVPGTGSPALSGCTTPSDSFFDSVTFIGGIDPSDDWTAGWTIHDAS
jgi:hypothetical protein